MRSRWLALAATGGGAAEPRGAGRPHVARRPTKAPSSASSAACLRCRTWRATSEGIRKNAAAVSALLEKRGVKTRYLEVPGAPPVVYGEIPAANAARTIIFYAHYDGQPLDPKEWATPPWEPVRSERTAASYARSGQRRQGAPIIAISSAPLDALQAAKLPHPLQHQVRLRRRGRGRLAAPRRRSSPSTRTCWPSDVWLICDGPVHQSRRQQIVFGARGVTTHRHHALRPESRTAQRPLRQLGAESRDGAGAPAGRP